MRVSPAFKALYNRAYELLKDIPALEDALFRHVVDHKRDYSHLQARIKSWEQHREEEEPKKNKNNLMIINP